MDEIFGALLPLLFFVWVPLAIVKRLKKQQVPEKMRYFIKSLAKLDETGWGQKTWQEIVSQKAPMARPDATVQSRMGTTPAYQPVKPRTFLEGESSGEGQLAGSMEYQSTEGLDLCDSTLGHGDSHLWDLEQELQGLPQQHSLPFALHGDSLVQAVVMSEVLARPGQRKWGKR